MRAPTRPHPEAANLPPFCETTFAAAKQVDVALDQARMPSLVPTSGDSWQQQLAAAGSSCRSAGLLSSRVC